MAKIPGPAVFVFHLSLDLGAPHASTGRSCARLFAAQVDKTERISFLPYIKNKAHVLITQAAVVASHMTMCATLATRCFQIVWPKRRPPEAAIAVQVELLFMFCLLMLP